MRGDDENTEDGQVRKAGKLARQAAARLPASMNRQTGEVAERVAIFPAADVAQASKVAALLEADDPVPDMHVGGLSVDRDSLLLAGLIACDQISNRTLGIDALRSKRMDNVIQRRYAQITQRVETGFNPSEVLRLMSKDWDRPTRTVALIELASADPFSPFDLKHNRSDSQASLNHIGELIGAQTSEIDNVQRTLRDATKSHRTQSLSSIGLWGVGGAMLVGAVGFAAAPVIGTALGSAAGLSGAAATSFGLSTLGGGSIAAGGLGMTGGLWLVAGTAAATGLVGSGGGALLYSLGGREFRSEIVKLQATYKLVALQMQTDQAIVTELHEDAELLTKQVAEERELNDANSHRIKELETKIESIEEAIKWMDSLEAGSG